MPFTYDLSSRSAINKESGVEIAASHKFTDMHPETLYEYKENGKSFEFIAMTKYINKNCIVNRIERVRAIPMAIFVLEISLSRGVSMFLLNANDRDRKSAMIKNSIREGLLVMHTMGGVLGFLTPELEVKFVNNFPN